MVGAADDHYRGDARPRLQPSAQSANLGEGPERAVRDAFDGHLSGLKRYKKMPQRRRNQSGTLEKIDWNGRIQEREFPKFEPANTEKQYGCSTLPVEFQRETLPRL